MVKRIFLFLMTNIAILLTISLLLKLTNAESYITSNGIDFSTLLLFSVIIGFSGSFISLFISKWMAKSIYNIQVIQTPQNEIEQFLIETVEKLSKKANIPMPEVGIYYSPDINAFATGPSKSNSIVAVSTGLLEKMDKDEIEGVLGHEISHIANGDMVTLTLIQGILNTFVIFFSRLFAYLIDRILLRNDKEEVSFAYHVSSFVLEILLGIFAMIIVMYFSRIREYSADRDSVSITSKQKMIKALEKIKQYYEIDKNYMIDRAGMNAFQISNKSSWLNIFSTHPSLDDRIRRLKQM